MLSALLWNLLLTSIMALAIAGLSRLAWLSRRPALRHTLWLLLLAKLITPPLIPVPFLPALESVDASPLSSKSVIAATDSEPLRRADSTSTALLKRATAETVTSAPKRAEPTSPDFQAAPSKSANRPKAESAAETRSVSIPPLEHVLLTLSLTGTFALLAFHCWRGIRFHGWLNQHRQANSALAECCEEVATSLGVRRDVASCVVDARTAPMLWGCWRPIVIIPRALIEELGPAQLRSIVAHELAHFQRADAWSNLFAFGVKALMWWNPVAWWAHRELREAQELCCDAVAIHVGSRSGYANTLLKALDFVQSQAIAPRELALGMGTRQSILRRFEMIADTKLSPRLSKWTTFLLVALAIPFSCIPVRGQQEPSERAAPSTAKNNLRGGLHPEAVVLSAIVERNNETTIWLLDRTANKQRVLRQGSMFKIGKVSAKVEAIEKDQVQLKIGDNIRTWKLGATFAALLKRNQPGSPASAKRKKADQPTRTQKSSKSKQPVTANDETSVDEANNEDSKRVKVQLEVVGDQMMIKGTKEDVEKVAEWLQRLKQGKLKAPADSTEKTEKNSATRAAQLQTYSTGSADPETVIAVLKTLLSDAKEVRMDADVKTGRLIVLGLPAHHETVKIVLDKLQPEQNEPSSNETGQNGKGRLRFAFRRVPWSEALDWYAQQAGLSLNSQDEIPGTFSYYDEKAYTVSEAMDLLNRVLLTRGFVLVRHQRLLHVLNLEKGFPAELAPQVEIDSLNKRGAFEYVSVVFTLPEQHAKEVLKEIQPLLSPGGRATALSQNGKILITERTGILRTIHKLIQANQDVAEKAATKKKSH